MLAGAEFALRVDDLGPLLALGLSLAGHGPLHRLREFEVAYLDACHFHSPRACLDIDDLLELGVDLVSLGQQVIQIRLAEDAA